MTFTEAAIHVLRRAGKPLHYKEITEIAITDNLLSHVGKTPEITMSSRLTTLTKREGDKGVIEKVRPGVFAIRDGAELPEVGEEDNGQSVDATTQNDGERQRPPGADLFDREDDDDDLIFADIDEDKSKKKRRRRKKRSDDDSGTSEKSKPEKKQASTRKAPEKDAKSTRSSSARSSTSRRSHEANATKANGDWSREKEEGELSGGGLADEMYEALAANGAALQYEGIAAALVASGRMAGDTRALVPTVAAALRSDNSRREAMNQRPRFSVRAGEARLVEWAHGRESQRALRDVLRAAEKQRDAVRREFLSVLDKLPLVSFVELLASWLNAESVSGLRAVAPPGADKGALHLAGNWNRGPIQTRVAIVALRSADVTPEAVVAARGALHHYADASEVWVITTGRVPQKAREEANAAGAAVVLLDGMALARSFERQGIGLRSNVTTVLAFDFALLEDLGVSVFEQQQAPREDADDGRSKRRRRGRRRGRDRDNGNDESGDAKVKGGSAEAKDAEAKDAEAKDAEEAASDESGTKKKTRRTRRRKPKDADNKSGSEEAPKEKRRRPAKSKSDGADDKGESSSGKGPDDGSATQKRGQNPDSDESKADRTPDADNKKQARPEANDASAN